MNFGTIQPVVSEVRKQCSIVTRIGLQFNDAITPSPRRNSHRRRVHLTVSEESGELSLGHLGWDTSHHHLSSHSHWDLPVASASMNRMWHMMSSTVGRASGLRARWSLIPAGRHGFRSLSGVEFGSRSYAVAATNSITTATSTSTKTPLDERKWGKGWLAIEG